VSFIVLLLWNALLGALMASRLHMNDFGKFYYSARLFLSGADMYQPTPATWIPVSSSVTGLFLNLNPPHLHLLILPLALLSPKWALAVWWVLNAVCLTLVCNLVRRELHVEIPGSFHGRLRAAAAFLGCSATGAVIVTGQLSFIIMLPMTLAWLAARHGRWRAAGVYLGVLMSVKAFLVIFIPYLLIRRKVDAVFTAAAAFVACFASGLIVFGLASHRAWLRTLSSVDWAWPPMNASFAGLLDRMLSSTPLFTPLALAPPMRRAVWMVGAATIATVTCYVVWRDTSPAALDRAFAVLLLAALLISPLGWIYYLWLALGPVAAFLTSPRYATTTSGAAPRLLRSGVVLFFFPWALTVVFQPNAVAAVIFGSIYFWALLMMWLALVLDSRNHSASPGQLLEAGSVVATRSTA
jgi:hypothetical protein